MNKYVIGFGRIRYAKGPKGEGTLISLYLHTFWLKILNIDITGFCFHSKTNIFWYEDLFGYFKGGGGQY